MTASTARIPQERDGSKAKLRLPGADLPRVPASARNTVRGSRQHPVELQILADLSVPVLASARSPARIPPCAGRRFDPARVLAGSTARAPMSARALYSYPVAKVRDEAEAVGVDRAVARKGYGAAKAERASREPALRNAGGERRLLQRNARPGALGGDVTGGERPARASSKLGRCTLDIRGDGTGPGNRSPSEIHRAPGCGSNADAERREVEAQQLGVTAGETAPPTIRRDPRA